MCRRLVFLVSIMASSLALPGWAQEGDDTAPIPIEVTVADLLAGRVGDWVPGESFDPTDARLTATEPYEGLEHYELTGTPLNLAGFESGRTTVSVRNGQIITVSLQRSAQNDDVDALVELVDALCAPAGGIDRYMPSPLGTPGDNPDDWDPVYLTQGDCTVETESSVMYIREEQNEGSDYRRSDVNIVLTDEGAEP